MSECRNCGEEKGEEEFTWRKKGVVRHKVCKTCQRAYNREYYAQNRDKEIARAVRNKAKQRQRLREFLFEYLSTHPCVDCGEDDIIVLEIDHVRGKKDYTINGIIVNGVSIERAKEELAKCEIRCANCHRRRHAAKGRNFRLGF